MPHGSRHSRSPSRASALRSVERVRAVDLAVYADSLAAEAAALQARLERARGRLRQAAIEREAREALPADVVARLRRLGLLGAAADIEAMEELEELQRSRAALEQLQAWVEARLYAEQERARTGLWPAAGTQPPKDGGARSSPEGGPTRADADGRGAEGAAARGLGALRRDEAYAAARFGSPASSAER